MIRADDLSENFSLWQRSSNSSNMRALLTVAFAVLAIPFAVYGKDSTPTAHPMADLRDRITQAIAHHDREVVIPPGVYRGGPLGDWQAILNLRGATDLRIVARGVEMICTKRTRAIAFEKCRNVELVGLTIDYDPLTFTQGTVTAVAPDKSWIEVMLDDGYPRMPFARVDVVDPLTRYRKHGMPFLWGTKAALVQPNVVRVTLKGIGDAAPVGSLASLNEGNEPNAICHGVTFEYCGGGMVLRDLTIYCAPGMGIVEHAGAGGTKLLGVRIVPGPPPTGATQPRLLTTSWDGILHTEVRHGPDVEHCTIEKCGDDSWSVQSDPLLVVKSSGDQIVVAGSIDLQPGDHLRHSWDATNWPVHSARRVPLAAAELDAATVERLNKAAQYTLWSIGHDTLQIVTLESPVTGGFTLPKLEVGTSVYSPENQGNGFVFRDNRTHSSGRVLIKAGDGLVEGNTLLDSHNVVILPEVSKGGAYGIANITIRNNRIVGAENFNTMPWSQQAGGLCVAGMPDAPPGSIAHITIVGNTFEDISAANIWMNGVRDVTLTNNHFIRPDQNPLSDSGRDFGVHPSSVIQLRRCDSVHIQDNLFSAPGSYEKQLLDLDNTDTQVQITPLKKQTVSSERP